MAKAKPTHGKRHAKHTQDRLSLVEPKAERQSRVKALREQIRALEMGINNPTALEQSIAGMATKSARLEQEAAGKRARLRKLRDELDGLIKAARV